MFEVDAIRAMLHQAEKQDVNLKDDNKSEREIKQIDSVFKTTDDIPNLPLTDIIKSDD